MLVTYILAHTIVSNPTVNNIRKNNTAQRLGIGILEMASVHTMKVRPGPTNTEHGTSG
jgi:hypothetical protein